VHPKFSQGNDGTPWAETLITVWVSISNVPVTLSSKESEMIEEKSFMCMFFVTLSTSSHSEGTFRLFDAAQRDWLGTH
jgi:hypothetical protein